MCVKCMHKFFSGQFCQTDKLTSHQSSIKICSRYNLNMKHALNPQVWIDDGGSRCIALRRMVWIVPTLTGPSSEKAHWRGTKWDIYIMISFQFVVVCSKYVYVVCRTKPWYFETNICCTVPRLFVFSWYAHPRVCFCRFFQHDSPHVHLLRKCFCFNLAPVVQASFLWQSQFGGPSAPARRLE